MTDLALIDECLLIDYFSGDTGAGRLIDRLLSGEIELAISAAATLQMWCYEILDRKTELHLTALMRFIDQLPLSGNISKTGGSIYARLKPDSAEIMEDGVRLMLRAVSAATSLDSNIPIYTKEINWYKQAGCEVLEY